MTIVRHWVGAIIAVLVIALPSSIGYASVPMPHTPNLPPRPSDDPFVESDSLLANVTPLLDLPRLKAVLIVGPIDGDQGDWTTYEKKNMDLAAAELQSNGVEVLKFYTPDNDWEQIKAASQGAHFLLYRGHGVYWPPPEMPSPPVGGFALKNRIVSSHDIREGLALAPGAIVMLYACFAAGDSSLDSTEIGSQEAQRRVAQYSNPFLDIGAGGYYANWYGNAPQMFIRYLFSGLTLGEAYRAFFDFNPVSVETFSHPEHAEMVMWLDKNFWSNRWRYSNAFAGLPNSTLEDLFNTRMMVITPEIISYKTQGSSVVKTFDLEVECTTDEPFEWTATIEPENASWIELQPAMSGCSGQQFTVVVDPRDLPAGIYSAAVHVTAQEDGDIQNSDQIVQVEMTVSGELNHRVFLPIIMR